MFGGSEWWRQERSLALDSHVHDTEALIDFRLMMSQRLSRARRRDSYLNVGNKE